MKKPNTILIVSMLILLTFISSVTAQNDNSMIYVDDDGTVEYTSIQDAIDDASEGDIIFVYKGTYNEVITIDKSIHLLGEDKDKTVIDTTGISSSSTVFINHPNVHFEGFSLIDADDLWHDEAAVIAVKSSSNIIKNNIIITNVRYGIQLYPLVKDNSILQNYITAIDVGLHLKFSWNNLISGNHIVGGSGLHSWGVGTKQQSVEQCFGIYAEYSFKNTFKDNNISGNGMGICFWDCNFNSFSQNNFMNHGDNVYAHPRFSINTWDDNYWNDYAEEQQFHFVTWRYIPLTTINLIIPSDFLRIDWHPALEPFNIPI